MASGFLPFVALLQLILGCHARGIKISHSKVVNANSVNGTRDQSGSTGEVTVINGNLDVQINTPGVSQFPPNGNSSIVRGLECGSTVQMYPGNSAKVFSTNFGIAHYYNNEACTWKFQANQCTLSAYCPCADIPKSWECLGDYLKISTDYILQNQRFCGGNKPGQPIYSDTDFLSVRFRSDGKITAAGFTCFVRCEGPGNKIPIIANFTCPTSASLRGW